MNAIINIHTIISPNTIINPAPNNAIVTATKSIKNIKIINNTKNVNIINTS